MGIRSSRNRIKFVLLQLLIRVHINFEPTQNSHYYDVKDHLSEGREVGERGKKKTDDDRRRVRISTEKFLAFFIPNRETKACRDWPISHFGAYRISYGVFNSRITERLSRAGREGDLTEKSLVRPPKKNLKSNFQ